MTDFNDNDDNFDDDFEIPSRLEELKKKADLLNISYHPSIGEDKLAEKIKRHQEKFTKPEQKQEQKKAIPIAGHVDRNEAVKLHRAQINKLIRCKIRNLNPAKKNWPGEWCSVGSAKLGTITKFIPTNSDSYFVPKILLEELRQKEYSEFFVERARNGVKIKRSRLTKEYIIEELPPLSPEELKDLADKQALAGAVDNA